MKKYSYNETEGGKPLFLWNSHAAFEDAAMTQLHNVARLPFIHHHVAGMPDVHLGIGATVGSVIATKGAVVPAAVGVDIGCGMKAAKTNLTASDLPDNLSNLRSAIEKAVPHGRTNHGGKGDRGAWGEISADIIGWANLSNLNSRYSAIIEKHPRAKSHNVFNHMGTLGTGNHFIEICLDENNDVWVMLHSGSRGAGNRIGTYFIEAAKKEMERYHITNFLPDSDLAYLVEHTEIFNDYLEAVQWAQDFARLNRSAMMDAVFKCIKTELGRPVHSCTMAINCHHNYVSMENHYGANVWVTRKGAVRAGENDLGIIPGSMGTGSFIVRGLGSKESFCSCSHGAGRVMSRTQAKKLISMEQHAKAMQGIEARLDADVIDESPAAYKDIGAVMEAQSDLVEIKHRLRQVLNVKG
jgi:tRNA-splicing ligase RtcB